MCNVKSQVRTSSDLRGFDVLVFIFNLKWHLDTLTPVSNFVVTQLVVIVVTTSGPTFDTVYAKSASTDRRLTNLFISCIYEDVRVCSSLSVTWRQWGRRYVTMEQTVFSIFSPTQIYFFSQPVCARVRLLSQISGASLCSKILLNKIVEKSCISDIMMSFITQRQRNRK